MLTFSLFIACSKQESHHFVNVWFIYCIFKAREPSLCKRLVYLLHVQSKRAITLLTFSLFIACSKRDSHRFVNVWFIYCMFKARESSLCKRLVYLLHVQSKTAVTLLTFSFFCLSKVREPSLCKRLVYLLHVQSKTAITLLTFSFFLPVQSKRAITLLTFSFYLPVQSKRAITLLKFRFFLSLQSKRVITLLTFSFFCLSKVKEPSLC